MLPLKAVWKLRTEARLVFTLTDVGVPLPKPQGPCCIARSSSCPARNSREELAECAAKDFGMRLLTLPCAAEGLLSGIDVCRGDEVLRLGVCMLRTLVEGGCARIVGEEGKVPLRCAVGCELLVDLLPTILCAAGG